MCGFVGIKNFQNSDLDYLHLMSNSIQHRGPDSNKQLVDYPNSLAIAFQRLSILDLSNNGDQPMHSSSKRYIIAFNGEIYNWNEIKNLNEEFYQFKNDTEVLVNMHEKFSPFEIPNKIDGMFAYCVYDQKRKKIYFSSDTQGEKKYFILTMKII